MTSAVKEIFPAQCPKPRIGLESEHCLPRQQKLFADICELVKPSTILEIGSWMGASAIAWANHARIHREDVKVYCVDTWLGSAEHFLDSYGGEWSRRSLLQDDYGPAYFDTFLTNVHSSGNKDRIIPFRADSSSALPFFIQQDLKFDVIYIDGAHDIHAVKRDLVLSLDLLTPNGVICGDDFAWSSVKMGLTFASLLKRSEKLRFLHRKDDYVVLRQATLSCSESLEAKGYKRWNPLRPRLLLRPWRLLRVLVSQFE